MIDDRTPVLVGAGQVVLRDAAARLESGDTPSPMDLAGRAAKLAVEDCAARGDVAAALDTVVVVRLFSDSSPRGAHEHGRATNPPVAVARRIGAKPYRRIYAEVGGNTPQKYLNRMADAIAEGRCGAVLLAGGEALATLKLARRSGAVLDWGEEGDDNLEDLGFGKPFLDAYEIRHGITYPKQVYPLFEQVIRGERDHGIKEHLLEMGALLAPFSEVAAANPYAYFRSERSARELATLSERNGWVALPYPRLMNARDAVDQAAAVIMTSVEVARSLGIPPERWVFPHGGADANEPLMSHRVTYDRAPAIRVMSERAFGMTAVDVDDVALFDIYSCFPSAVEIACVELGVSENDTRGLTVTGGLPFFGGPGNNYSTHAIAEMVKRLRERPGEYGLVTANGGYLSKHSMGIYSTTAPESLWQRTQPEQYQAQIDSRQSPVVVEEAEGEASIETYTVAFDREGPQLGIIIGRLQDGSRFLANTPEGDTATLKALVDEEGLGYPGWVRREGDKNTFHLDV